ncbi:RNA polymerase sigma factor [Jeotgalibacillus alimentarius]|uniref:RNA polymerase sigma factor n=1 Tax=Jeotgalibacillus alimentarius TaxID=135826 RepID=A0A0C2SC07_9BACL|nr:sigma-70 family RNA polymerase sigma factor [Jeotgalibacillus alimentarius]KIL51479.1 RNA polymerase sigma factor [Jeotgalibacillus alimentarius]
MKNDEKDRLLRNAMEEHGDYLKRLIYTYVKDVQKAEDILQDTFVKFYTRFDQFEKRSSVKTYLYRIAVNESQNYLRSWSFRKVEFADRLRTFKQGTSAEDQYITNEGNRTLGELVKELPVKYREVIWLYYYDELTVNEISEILACSPNTVKTRLSRGRKLAKISIEEGDYEY